MKFSILIFSIFAFLAGLIIGYESKAGINTLPTETGPIIQLTHVNKFKTALSQDLVPRNSSGVVTAEGGQLGTSTFPWAPGFIRSVTIGDANATPILSESGNSLTIDTAFAGTTIDFKINGVLSSQITSAGLDGVYLKTASIGAGPLAADSVGASEIQANAVGLSEMADNSVGTTEIIDGAVANADILNNTITNSKLASSVLAVDTSGVEPNDLSVNITADANRTVMIQVQNIPGSQCFLDTDGAAEIITLERNGTEIWSSGTINIANGTGLAQSFNEFTQLSRIDFGASGSTTYTFVNSAGPDIAGCELIAVEL